MGIIWLYIYQNFLSFGIFLWLFFSFLYLHISTNDFWTKFALIPSINVSFICISISRINDILNISNEESIKIKYFHFALGEYDYDYLRYFFIIIFYFFANYFLHVLNIFNKKIISSAIKYREEEENEKNKTKNNINIIKLLIKIFLANIDKITLVSLYIVIFPTINFLHFILTIIFILQLFFPNLIKYISMIFIQIFHLFFIIEYILDLSKVYNYDSFKQNILKLKFVMPYNEDLDKTAVEILLYLIIYCFYVQYQLNSHEEYQTLLNDKDLTLENLIKIHFGKNKKLRKILFFIGNIILTIYIWFLVLLIIFILCYYEVNLLFAVGLIIFLISLYFFALNIQEPESKTRKLNIKLGKILLYYSGIYTFFMYLYQIIFHDLFNIINEIYILNNIFINNLPNIGFTKYPEDILYYKLFPFFSANFLFLLYKTKIQNGFNYI